MIILILKIFFIAFICFGTIGIFFKGGLLFLCRSESGHIIDILFIVFGVVGLATLYITGWSGVV